MAETRIGFLGAGRMATALAQGLIQSGFTSAGNVIASDPIAAARDNFTYTTQARCTDRNQEVLKNSRVVILAVKPPAVSKIVSELADEITEEHLIVSIAAGVSLSTIESLIPSRRVIRVMPNTPCLVGAGASGFARGAHADDVDAELVTRMLSTVGIAMEVPESLLDAVTALSGSGPAYAFEMIEALSDGGVLMGLPRNVATQLAAQTLMGAAKMVLETGQHPGQLKDAVTSPGGTTIAGLHVLEDGGMRGLLMSAVEAAALRSRELAEESGSS